MMQTAPSPSITEDHGHGLTEHVRRAQRTFQNVNTIDEDAHSIVSSAHSRGSKGTSKASHVRRQARVSNAGTSTSVPAYVEPVKNIFTPALVSGLNLLN